MIYQLGRGLCRLSRKSSERPWVHRSATEEEQVMNMDFRRMWRRWRGDTGAWINFNSWVTIFSFDLIYLKGSEPILLRPSSSHAVRTLLSSRLSRGCLQVGPLGTAPDVVPTASSTSVEAQRGSKFQNVLKKKCLWGRGTAWEM